MPPSIITTPAGAKAAIATLAATAAPHPRLVLFTATRDAGGVPWCPDCARSITGVRAAADALGGSLVEVEVSRPEWKNPGNPSPLRAEYGITGIPALALVGEGGGVERVLGAALEGAAGDAAAEALVREWAG